MGSRADVGSRQDDLWLYSESPGQRKPLLLSDGRLAAG
jgi:hypothetical protein